MKKNKYCLKSNCINLMQYLLFVFNLRVGGVAGCRVLYERFCAGRVDIECSSPCTTYSTLEINFLLLYLLEMDKFVLQL